MPTAIVLVCVSSDMETNVLKKLKNCSGVLEVFHVHGAYDLVVRVKTDTFDLLRDSVAKIKQSLPKIQNMVTMLIVENPNSISHGEYKKIDGRGD